MAIKSEQISLRGVIGPDYELLLAWRNDREVMRYLPSAPGVLTWEEHYQDRDGRVDLMITLDDGVTRPRSVGTVHFDLRTREIGIIIGEKPIWGQGIGTVALARMLVYVDKMWPIGVDIWAVVHPENLRSRRLFEKLGFVAEGVGRNGQIRYVKHKVT